MIPWYDTVQAEDGLVGLNHLKGSVFDIVLCDFLMPVMDGMDCVREYRKWENTFRKGFK
jgi:CheY-like chemotaxis protein